MKYFKLQKNYYETKIWKFCLQGKLGEQYLPTEGSKLWFDCQWGMLINNRPDGTTGIRQAADVKKAMHNAEKTERMANAVFLGTMRSEMMEGPEMD